MADPNKLRITRDAQGTEVLVSDDQGQVHNVSAKFREIVDSTSPGGFTNCFKAQVDGTETSIQFTAIDKELNYTLPPEVAKQIVALL